MADIRAQLLAAFEVEHREHIDAIRRALASPGKADLREVFRRAHSLKGAARAVDLPRIEDIAHRLEEVFAAVGEGRLALDPAVQDVVHHALDAIEAQAEAARLGRALVTPQAVLAALDRLTGETPAADAELPAATDAAETPEPEGAGGQGLEFVRLDTQVLRRLSQAANQLSIEIRNAEAAPQRLRRLQRDARRLQQLWSEIGAEGGGRRNGVHARDFDASLKGLARELRDLVQTQTRRAWSLGAGFAQMREQVERIALTPAEAVFGDIGRMARELARESHLEVDVRVHGLEVRAERRVLQALRDPIIHLIRNALSHGAESPEARQAAGKPERLLVGLDISARGGRLQASVYDDGPGPDLGKIEAAAVEKGLLRPRGPDEVPPTGEEILALAFEPGISSAGAVNRLSGRGMGLSVVLQAVRALGGSAQLSARQPHGAEVTLTAPLSAARQTVVLLEEAGASYALPTFAVTRLLRIPRRELQSVEGAPAVRIEIDGQDVLAPVAPLGEVLGAPMAQESKVAGMVNAAVLARGERYVAFAADALVDVREIAVQTLEAPGMDPALTLGAGLIEDEAPVTVLNPDGLFDRWLRDERRLAAAGLGLAASARQERPRQKTVLVVDDSFTTRTLEKSILESQGYQVVLAVDGMQALEALRAGETVIDLVVADIEMPRMDGFTLLQAIKADAGLANLPVILMTSRNDPTDVRRGMDLGAEAYITKQKFDQRELLATIGRIL